MNCPQLLIFAFAVGLFTFGCSKKQENELTPDPVFRVETDGLEKAKQVAITANVECDTLSPCSPSVGMLTMSSEVGAGACTASMIGPDLAITNSHCIPDDLKQSDADCSDRIWLTFPKAGQYEKERIECDRVLEASDLGDSVSRLTQDYAFLRMKKTTQRPSLAVSQKGFRDNEQYRVNKVNPAFNKGQLHGDLISENCKAILGNEITKALDERYPLVLLSDCNIIHGNSGGPINGSDGKIHGVIQAFLRLEKVKLNLEEEGFDVPLTFARSNIGTSLSCLKIPDYESTTDPTCSSYKEEDISLPLKLSAIPLNSETINEMFREKLMQKSSPLHLLQWRTYVESTGREQIVHGDPICMPFSDLMKTADTDYSIAKPAFKLMPSLDKYFRLQWILKEGEKKIAVRLSKNSEYSILMQWSDSVDSMNKVIPTCEENVL